MSDNNFGAIGNAGVPIVLDELTKLYPGQQAPAVDRVSMTIPAGQLVAFVGPSGCGKTTTMKMINRLIEPSSGSITIGGENVLAMDPTQLRRRIGYVIQQIGLFPHMTIAENIAVVPKLLGWKTEKTKARVDELLHLVSLDAGTFAHRYPKQLSGGQQQRVGVARALAADPPVMLMDEPFGATDPITREKLQNEFLDLQRRLGKTIIFVTHDFEEAIKLGDRIAVLADSSRIVQYDTPGAILSAPADDYVASFVGSDAAIKRLGLFRVADATLRPVTANDADLPTVSSAATLRAGLSAIIAHGGGRVLVADGTDAPKGVLDTEAVADALQTVAATAPDSPVPAVASVSP